MEFQPLFKASTKPNWETYNVHCFIRGQFRIETFMICGAIVQAILSIILPWRYVFVPTGFIVLAKIANIYAIKTGLKQNPHMEDVIPSKFSAQFPDSSGKFGNQPSRDGMCVFLIGIRNNSIEGLFKDEFGKLTKFLKGMIAELETNPNTGFFGNSLWFGTERASNSSMLFVMYFKSGEHVHNFAHGPLHREAWAWWYQNIANLREISIWHELYEVPSGNHQSIYDHSPPLLAAATQHRVLQKTGQSEEEAFILPIVDARKGPLKTSLGRMAKSEGMDNDRYGYADEEVYPEVHRSRY